MEVNFVNSNQSRFQSSSTQPLQYLIRIAIPIRLHQLPIRLCINQFSNLVEVTLLAGFSTQFISKLFEGWELVVEVVLFGTGIPSEGG